MATTRSKSSAKESPSAYGADSVEPDEDAQEEESEEVTKEEVTKNKDIKQAKDVDESSSDDEAEVLLGYEPSLLQLKETATLKTTKCKLLFKGNKELWNDFKWSFRAFLQNSSDGVYLPTELIDHPMATVIMSIETKIHPYLETLSEKEQRKTRARIQGRIIQDRKSIVLVMMNVIQGSVTTLLRGCASDDCWEMWQAISREYEDVGDFQVVMSFRRLTNYRAPATMPVALVYRQFDDSFRLLAEQGEIFSDRLKCGMFIDSLPKEYESIIHAIYAQAGKLVWKTIADRMQMTKGLTVRATSSRHTSSSSTSQSGAYFGEQDKKSYQTKNTRTGGRPTTTKKTSYGKCYNCNKTTEPPHMAWACDGKCSRCGPAARWSAKQCRKHNTKASTMESPSNSKKKKQRKNAY